MPAVCRHVSSCISEANDVANATWRSTQIDQALGQMNSISRQPPGNRASGAGQTDRITCAKDSRRPFNLDSVPLEWRVLVLKATLKGE